MTSLPSNHPNATHSAATALPGPSPVAERAAAPELPFDHPQAIGCVTPAAPAATTLQSLIETTKPGITKLVTITSLVGFVMASIGRAWTAGELVVSVLACIVGTALSAAGANAINQWMERERDFRMPRTAKRPLPQKRVSPALVLSVGLGLSVAGLTILGLLNNLASASLSLACLLVYVLIYTPLKPRTTWSTLVGAIPGALPPLIGWCAASPMSEVDPTGFAALSAWPHAAGGWSLFALMFAWQMPHFMAIAWMYRDDYAKGGYRVLPVLDPDGSRTARTVALWSAALIPVTLLPAWFMPESLGFVYVLAAAVSGGAFMWLVSGFILARDRASARKLFFASIIQLPLLLGAMVVEALARAVWPMIA